MYKKSEELKDVADFKVQKKKISEETIKERQMNTSSRIVKGLFRDKFRKDYK